LEGGIEGRVERISMRSTVVITNENLAVIMPNSKLVQNKFINYSFGNRLVRLNIPVGVAYSSDLEKVSEALMEAAASVKEVLSDPVPAVHFAEFGDSALNLQIRVWIDQPRDHTAIQSRVNFAIERSFRKRNIEIPFPQRDIHLSPEALRLLKEGTWDGLPPASDQAKPAE